METTLVKTSEQQLDTSSKMLIDFSVKYKNSPLSLEDALPDAINYAKACTHSLRLDYVRHPDDDDICKAADELDRAVADAEKGDRRLLIKLLYDDVQAEGRVEFHEKYETWEEIFALPEDHVERFPRETGLRNLVKSLE